MNAQSARLLTEKFKEQQAAQSKSLNREELEELKKAGEEFYEQLLLKIERAALHGSNHIEFLKKEIYTKDSSIMKPYQDLDYFDTIADEERKTKEAVALFKLKNVGGFRITVYWNIDNTGNLTNNTHFIIRIWW